MANISYFQRYSQRENHITNNTLLVMRHFYQVSPQKISGVLTELCGEELSVGLQFKQQVKLETSVPDALISQAPLANYFETKRGEKLHLSQIDRHLESINRNTRNHDQKFLFGLTKTEINDVDRKRVLKRVKEKSKNVTFVSITFSKMVQALRDVCADHETTLCEILSDYESYLENENLIPGQILSAFPVGGTFDENVKYRLYFEPSKRSSKVQSSFIGLYRNKRIEQLASFDTVVVGRNVEGPFKHEKGELSDEKRQRIQGAIEDHPTLVDKDHRYYLFVELYDTNFVKRSRGGMMGYRKFHLAALLDYDNTDKYSAQEVAQHLMDKEWE